MYYRLSTVPIYVPPLRERGKDIELLFRKFAADFADKYKVKPIVLTEEAKEILLAYRFPGNIRQLKNLVEQISVLSSDHKDIDPEELQHYLPKAIYAACFVSKRCDGKRWTFRTRHFIQGPFRYEEGL